MTHSEADIEKRARALRIARESLGLPDSQWSMNYDTTDLELAAGYLKIAHGALQNELARRADRLTGQMKLDLRVQRQRVVSSFSSPEESLCTHGMRPGVCPDC